MLLGDSMTLAANQNNTRRCRTWFAPEQLESLERAFHANTYPNAQQREQISAETGLSEAKIQVKLFESTFFYLIYYISRSGSRIDVHVSAKQLHPLHWNIGIRRFELAILNCLNCLSTLRLHNWRHCLQWIYFLVRSSRSSQKWKLKRLRKNRLNLH